MCQWYWVFYELSSLFLWAVVSSWSATSACKLLTFPKTGRFFYFRGANIYTKTAISFTEISSLEILIIISFCLTES
jgi:hypothetical protein